jgi:hypothetical protein
MKIFDEDKLNDLFLQQKEDLNRLISPIIDQIVLIKMRREILPRKQYEDKERAGEFKALMDYYVGLIHQIIGYNPQE